MTIFYSPASGGFYTDEIHGADGIPADAVEITDAEHAALLDAQSAGKIIKAGAEGKPVASDPPAPTDDQLAASARLKRDRLLAACDWTQLADVQAGAAWATYRQALRDVPSQPGFPRNIEWPEPIK